MASEGSTLCGKAPDEKLICVAVSEQRMGLQRIATLEIVRFAYLTPKFEFLPICPQIKFFVAYLILPSLLLAITVRGIDEPREKDLNAL